MCERRTCAVLVAMLVLALAAPATMAAPVGWWRMEGTPGAAVGTEANALSPGTHDGTGGGGATYAATVPNQFVHDPISGAAYHNLSSLDMSGGRTVTIPDHNDLDAPNFTIEAFVRVPDQSGYPGYARHFVASDSGWQLDVDPQEEARVRFDTGNVVPFLNQVAGSGSNQALGHGEWHHTAVTFDGTTIRHYTDYGNLSTRTLVGDPAKATSVAANVILGSFGATGAYLDEVRYTNEVLQPSQFLRQGGPVGYWRFEGDPGTVITTEVNSANPGTHDGTGENGAALVSSVPGCSIVDPLTGTTYSNTASMDMSGGKRVRVLDHDDLDAPIFTIEAFVKMGDQTSYPAYIAHMVSYTGGWQLDIDPQEEARTRFDTGNVVPYVNQLAGSGANQALGHGQWHHTAVTFDGTTIRHYTDYAVLATKTLVIPPGGDASIATNVAADMMFGGSFPAGSCIDEIRYINAVLGPDEFLRAIPEPGTLTLVTLGCLGIAARRRRRKS